MLVDMLVDMAAGAARARFGLRDSGYASRFKRPGLSERRDKARCVLSRLRFRSCWGAQLRHIRGRLVSNLTGDSTLDSYGHACSTDCVRLSVLVFAPSHQAGTFHSGNRV
jgi:hypothetical protein